LFSKDSYFRKPKKDEGGDFSESVEDEDGDASVISISPTMNPEKMKTKKITFYFVSQPLRNQFWCSLLARLCSYHID